MARSAKTKPELEVSEQIAILEEIARTAGSADARIKAMRDVRALRGALEEQGAEVADEDSARFDGMDELSARRRRRGS